MDENKLDGGLESLRRILLLMEYDVAKTSSENELFSEQTSYETAFEIAHRDPKSAEAWNKAQYEMLYEYRHGIMDIASIGAFFIPIVGPALSLGLQLANSAMYAAEGDKYMAGFGLAFSLIPFGQLAAKIPGAKKLGAKGMATLYKKVMAKSPQTLSVTEKEVLNSIKTNSNWVKVTASREAAILAMKAGIKQRGLKGTIGAIYSLYRGWNKLPALAKVGLEIGGVWYSYDKLAQIYGLKGTPAASMAQQKQLELEFKRNEDACIEAFVNNMKGNLTTEDINKAIAERIGPELE